jgi:ADP-ribose pyrophosphatase YjhB (NUDIX family)
LRLGVRACLFDADRRVLLVRDGPAGAWKLPGGGVRRTETAGAALQRLLLSQTGIALENRPEIFAMYVSHEPYRSEHLALYVVRGFEPPGHAVEDTATADWFSPEATPPATDSATMLRLSEIIEGRPVAAVC